MKVNREKSKTFKQVIGIGLVSLISVSAGLSISSDLINLVSTETIQQRTRIEQEDKMFEGELSQEENYYNYLMNINNADLSQFDNDFLDFYRNGVIYIDGHEEPIKVSQLLILSNGSDESFEFHVVSYKNMNYDILNDCNIELFERDYLMDFINSNCFYDFYVACRDNNCINDNVVHINSQNRASLVESLQSYDKSMHDKAPETYYMRFTH